MAANLGLISFGSDTGSSIRTPSGFQALVGLRPSTGLVSRYGPALVSGLAPAAAAAGQDGWLHVWVLLQEVSSALIQAW